MEWTDLEAPASVVASVVTVVGITATVAGVLVALIFGIRQAKSAVSSLEVAKRANQLQAMIAFDQLLEKYHHIHTGLRPGGDLRKKEDPSHQECVDIERYMGLFERAQIFLDDGFLRLDRFKDLYGYRMKNIASQPWVLEAKLRKQKNGWARFLDLYRRVYPEDHEMIDNDVPNDQRAESDDDGH